MKQALKIENNCYSRIWRAKIAKCARILEFCNQCYWVPLPYCVSGKMERFSEISKFWQLQQEKAAYLRQTSQPRNYLTALPLHHGTDDNKK